MSLNDLCVCGNPRDKHIGPQRNSALNCAGFQLAEPSRPVESGPTDTQILDWLDIQRKKQAVQISCCNGLFDTLQSDACISWETDTEYKEWSGKGIREAAISAMRECNAVPASPADTAATPTYGASWPWDEGWDKRRKHGRWRVDFSYLEQVEYRCATRDEAEAAIRKSDRLGKVQYSNDDGKTWVTVADTRTGKEQQK